MSRLSVAHGTSIVVWSIVIVVIFSGLGLRDPWPADEPRFALVAKEMVESGEWFFPRRGGELYSDKPPLFMWMIASIYQLTGNMRVAFILPSMLAGVITLLTVFKFLQMRKLNAYFGTLALLATIQFTLQAKTAQIDGVLCAFTTLSLCLLLVHLLIKPAWLLTMLAGFFAGMGVITKGVGFLPLFILIPYFLFARHMKGVMYYSVLDYRWLAMVLTFLLGLAVWLVPMLVWVEHYQTAEYFAYRDDILFHQTAERYVDSWGHIKPWHYFFSTVIVWAWFPLLALLPFCIKPLKQHIQQKRADALLVLCWIAIVLIFFSISPGKRGVYILPALPALAIAIAMLKDQIAWDAVSLWSWRILMFVAFAVPVSVVALALTNKDEYDIENPASILGAVIISLSMLGVLAVLARTFLVNKIRGEHALISYIFCFWVAVAFMGYPAVNRLRSTEYFMREVESHLSPADEIGIVRWKEQYSLFARLPVKQFGYHLSKEEQLSAAKRWEEQSKTTRWLLIPENLLEKCISRNIQPMGIQHRVNWLLVDEC